jgi:hypothetical protein
MDIQDLSLTVGGELLLKGTHVFLYFREIKRGLQRNFPIVGIRFFGL